MRFWITYQDDSRELFETYTADALVIKIMQLVMRFGGDVTTQRAQSASIIAHLLFNGKGQYPHDSNSSDPYFIIVDEKP